MAADVALAPAAPPHPAPSRASRGEWIAISAIALIAATLNLVGIARNGLGNLYYAVTVQSMTHSWHNWFFAAFDSGGFIAVDKPPLWFWLQTLSVHLFGFNGVALILPQALAGVVSVWLLYLIIRRGFGVMAALIGALALALAPISVVANRDNILESLVVTLLLGATLATVVALERGALGWLLVAAALVGLAFNVKMLEAYLALPALATAYLLAAPLPWRRRLWHVAAAGALLLVVSLAWVTVVDLVPAAQRPYVGSSYHNSEWDLVVAYNGLQRLSGTPWSAPPSSASAQGLPGPFRLFLPYLATQIGWLLPLALVGLLAAGREPWRDLWRSAGRLAARQGTLALWGVWLLTMGVIFSLARFFNPYYLALLAPAIAALTGIGLAALWSSWRAGQRDHWLLPVGVMATAVEQSFLARAAPAWLPWLSPLIILLAALAVVVWWLSLRERPYWVAPPRWPTPLLALALAGVIGLAPTLWTLASLHPDAQAGFPLAGPAATPDRATIPQANPRLIAYLRQHAGGATFLVATVTAADAEPIILATGAPVMALGGFSGFDPVLTPTTLAQRVARDDVRFFYLPANNLTPQQQRQIVPSIVPTAPRFTNALTQWVASRCVAVPPGLWRAAPATATTMQLFDCGALVP